MNQKELKEEAELRLKTIIKNSLSVDIDKDQRRLANTVLARMIYTVVLRDDGYTWESIARSINRNHSTVIYHYNTLPDLIRFDKMSERKYIEIKNEYYGLETVLDYQALNDLKKIIINLINDNKVLISRVKELERKL